MERGSFTWTRTQLRVRVNLAYTMVQLMLEFELAGGPLLAYTYMKEFIAKVCMFFLLFLRFFFNFVFFALVFSLSFDCRLGHVVLV